jgi:hypothetical protein
MSEAGGLRLTRSNDEVVGCAPLIFTCDRREGDGRSSTLRLCLKF